MWFKLISQPVHNKEARQVFDKISNPNKTPCIRPWKVRCVQTLKCYRNRNYHNEKSSRYKKSMHLTLSKVNTSEPSVHSIHFFCFNDFPLASRVQTFRHKSFFSLSLGYHLYLARHKFQTSPWNREI